LAPRYITSAWFHWLTMLLNITLITWGYFLLHPAGVEVELLVVIVIAITGIIAGWQVAAGTTILATTSIFFIDIWWFGYSQRMLIHVTLHLFLFLATGFLTNELTGIIRHQARETTYRNRELELLLETSLITTQAQDLAAQLPPLAKKIAAGLSVATCRICLLAKDTQHWVIYDKPTAYPLDGEPSALHNTPQIESLPLHYRTLQLGQIALIERDDASVEMSAAERAALFPDQVSLACLIPLVLDKHKLGVISVGVKSNGGSQPFRPETLNPLQAIAAQVAVMIHNANLLEDFRGQARRVRVLNEVAQAISTTIEMDDLLELIYEQLTLVIPCDSYYIALYDAQDATLDLLVFSDAGERYPSQKIPLGEGLASMVIREQKPLLIHHLSKELDRLPFKPITIGKSKLSESWMGAPILIGERIAGLLAVASYTPNAFEMEDLDLLSSIATQVAIALDNARHHAEIEEQARRDSLTGVYNHNYFLKRLNEEVVKATADRSSVSVIMLDIDHFKKYNDQYGHVVGDEVLRLTVQAIRTHIKKSDVVGRWGGEEFGIVLPNASTRQARLVAKRIQKTLAELPLVDREGQPIPKPTVSQGIATCPDHSKSPAILIDLADQALYRAKRKGRNRVEVTAQA
jgi:diguanylate cyclase (GGDEF)-like protein